MIGSYTRYYAVCDGDYCCTEVLDDYDYEDDAERSAMDAEWVEIDGKHYCPKCQKTMGLE